MFQRVQELWFRGRSEFAKLSLQAGGIDRRQGQPDPGSPGCGRCSKKQSLGSLLSRNESCDTLHAQNSRPDFAQFPEAVQGILQLSERAVQVALVKENLAQTPEGDRNAGGVSHSLRPQEGLFNGRARGHQFAPVP